MSEPVSLFVAALFSDPDTLAAPVAARLVSAFGPIILQSPLKPWQRSSYYDEEMGDRLFRGFYFFTEIVDSSILPEVKATTRLIEDDFSVEGRRKANLDPGYYSTAKVVLASRKNYSHRICIGRGVYAEAELVYRRGCFHPLPYTYGDYRDAAVLDLFSEARRLFKARLLTNRKRD